MGKIGDQLRAASEMLTDGTWGKGSYFSSGRMCVHGAIQVACNPAVVSVPANATEAAYAAAVAAHASEAALCSAPAERAWDNRPEWVTDTNAANYIAGIIGLTAYYNDDESTTLADIKAKLSEAASLADRLGL